MDIQHLIDLLEDLIDQGRHWPLSNKTMIDEERALELIDQMRISIPEEVDKAQRVMNQRDRMLAQANEEAARVVDLAREKGQALIERDAITQAAKNQVANILEEARQEAESIRGEADVYALEVLQELESYLMQSLQVVHNGIEKLSQERQEARTQARTRPPVSGGAGGAGGAAENPTDSAASGQDDTPDPQAESPGATAAGAEPAM
jgi:hypothetical protein